MAGVRLNIHARRIWNARWSEHHGLPYPQPGSIAFPSVTDQETAAIWYWEVGVKVLGFKPDVSPMMLATPAVATFYQEFIVEYGEMIEQRGLGAAMRAHSSALEAAGARPAAPAMVELP